jgi:dephospho-CoA kinase
MTVVAFGGRIASGKSTLATAVAGRLDMPCASFGDAVRAEAAKRGLPTDRATLQGLGDELIAAGWDAFVDTVVRQAHWDGMEPLVVDGVRHVEAVRALERRWAPHPVVVVFIEAAPGQRAQRLAGRGVRDQDIVAADSHPNEADLPAVRDRADIVIDNGAELPNALGATLAALARFGIASRPTHVAKPTPGPEQRAERGQRVRCPGRSSPSKWPSDD